MAEYLSQIEEQYIAEIKKFYAPYFEEFDQCEEFVDNAIRFEVANGKPRQMLFQVQRFVTLATEIDKIRPARDGLRVLFLKCCMESLLKLSDMKTKDFYKKFATFFSDDGEKYILDNFSLSYIEYEQNGVRLEKSCKLIMDDILQIIKEMRDMVVHEGNYWELQFFARDSEYQWLTHIQSDEQLLCEDTFKKYKSATYHFETTLQYERFKFYFVEACINYIVDYIKKKTEFNKG